MHPISHKIISTVRYFTSESVSEGHPDKLCDQISDAIVDAHLAQDPLSRLGSETTASTNKVSVLGEITSKAKVDIEKIVRDTVKRIGYDHVDKGLDYKTMVFTNDLHSQSPDIAQGVNVGEGIDKLLGAGDQGMMFGYACNQTPELMPLPIQLSHRLMRELTNLRKSGAIEWLRPDAKAQVTVEYEGKNIKRVDTVVISTQHSPDVDHPTIEKEIIEKLVKQVVPSEYLDHGTKYFINPTGRFVTGGPDGDSGLTGRKIIVDTYGGYARHGGGAFSGKDSTKVDRSAAYMARYVAKNLVAAGIAEEVEIQLAYAIGVSKPVSILVDTKGTSEWPENQIAALVQRHFDLSPAGIIERLDLRKPIFQQTAAYGHFGREDLDVQWEKTDVAQALADDLAGIERETSVEPSSKRLKTH